MTHQSQHEKVDIAAAGLGFIFWGTIYAIVLLFVTIASKNDSRLPPLFWWLFCTGVLTGVGMAFVGVGFKKRWRYVLVVAIPIFVFGLFQFPVGTAVFGWALRSLWLTRRQFFPFAKKIDAA